jgi:hypothetical protein
MKKQFVWALMLLFCLGIGNTYAHFAYLLKPAFTWQKTTHDFGKVLQNKPVSYEFEFTNTGDAPIVIASVQASCGCTTPSYTQEPIAPGKSGKITVQYNAATLGVFNKTVTITANVDQPITLTIKGEVSANAQ